MDYPVRILVVEDDNDINQLLCSIINKKGYFEKPAYSKTETIFHMEKQEISKEKTAPIIIVSTKLEQKKELRHKDLCVDTESKTVIVKGKELTFTPREYAIIELLLSNPRKVFSKANLFESVWNEEYRGDDNTINVHISNIRNKFSKANPDEEYIDTIWGIGYRTAK